MKHNNTSATFIKTTAIIFSSAIILFSSCKKDSSTNAAAVSEAEAAEAITQSVSGESGGMAVQVDASTEISNTQAALLACGASHDSSLTLTNSSGAAITFTANLSWSWTLNCNAGLPLNILFTASGSSVYDAPRMSSNDNSTATFEVSGLGVSSAMYNLNGTYTRNGTQQSKIFNKNSFASTITITSENIKVDKTTEEIVSGTATVSISGKSSANISFSYSGTITFLGNKKATLAMANGQTYNIAW